MLQPAVPLPAPSPPGRHPAGELGTCRYPSSMSTYPSSDGQRLLAPGDTWGSGKLQREAAQAMIILMSACACCIASPLSSKEFYTSEKARQ